MRKLSDAEAAALKAEFADQDLAFAESILTDYLSQLQQATVETQVVLERVSSQKR
jgi:hypothetical protein